jgi:hypothetical protein
MLVDWQDVSTHRSNDTSQPHLTPPSPWLIAFLRVGVNASCVNMPPPSFVTARSASIRSALTAVEIVKHGAYPYPVQLPHLKSKPYQCQC